MRRTILAVVSDTHGGNTGGLLNPNTTLYAEDEGGKRGYAAIDYAGTRYMELERQG